MRRECSRGFQPRIPKPSLGEAAVSLGKAAVSLGEAAVSLGEAAVSLGKATVSLGEATVSLGKAAVSLGEAAVSLGEAGIAGIFQSKPAKCAKNATPPQWGFTMCSRTAAGRPGYTRAAR